MVEFHDSSDCCSCAGEVRKPRVWTRNVFLEVKADGWHC